MKAINLISFLDSVKTLPDEILNMYLINFGIKPKKKEVIELESLVKEIISFKDDNFKLMEGFYIGYTINQISKEFDLLRFGKNSIVNIELKRTFTGDKISIQLKQNRYYLNFLEKTVTNITYVADEKKFYILDDKEDIVEVDILYLIEKLLEQEIEEIDDIDKYFNPSNYLVSPFNSTKRFIEGEYFLTDQQVNIKKEIMNEEVLSNSLFFSIQGAAGTGKTLLTYDLANEYRKMGKNVVIIHCGSLNDGQNLLINNYSWEIYPVKSVGRIELESYDLIILDEVQRIYKYQLNIIIERIRKTFAKCIFSYDPQQCLASKEINNKIPSYIEKEVSNHHWKLTEKIRTNKEIGSFIKNLFNLSKTSPYQKYTNISVNYFSSSENAIEFIDTIRKQDWKVINYTPSMYKSYPYDKYLMYFEDSAHKVIGQEFDSVVAIIDEHFYYASNGLLSTKGYKNTPYYHPTKMLFQIVTRTRKKLKLVIVNNKQVLDNCMKIISSSL